MKKTILIWSASYDPVLGGLQTVTRSLAEGLKTRGYNIIVLTNQVPSALPKQEWIDGIPVHRYRFYHPLRDIKQLKDIFIAGYGFLVYPFRLFQLFQFIRSKKPDIIHIHFPSQQLWYLGMLRSIFRRVEWVISLHGDELLQYFETKDGVVRPRLKEKKSLSEAIRLHILRSALSKADSVTTCSRYLMSMTQLLMQGRSFNGHVVYNGIEFSRFATRMTRPAEGKYLFAYGRLIFEKGFDLLITCFRNLLKQETEEYQLIIGGTGKELYNLNQLASGLGLNGKVIFPGRLSSQEVVAYLQHCAVAIIPSRKEPFGITLLEAIASRSNVVATDIGGMPEIAEYGNVLLCHPDQESLLKAIHEAIRKPGSHSPEKEIELSEFFSCEQMINQFEKILFHSQRASEGNSHIQPLFQNLPEKISKRWT